MRRGFSIFLIMVFGLGPLSAVMPGSEDASLPACCRRHGEHRCAMAARMALQLAQLASAPTVSAPLTCPEYPGLPAMFVAPVAALTASAATLPGADVRAFKPVAADIVPTSSPSLTHAGRGPPVARLA
jgi:hypothetical protein